MTLDFGNFETTLFDGESLMLCDWLAKTRTLAAQALYRTLAEAIGKSEPRLVIDADGRATLRALLAGTDVGDNSGLKHIQRELAIDIAGGDVEGDSS